MGGSGCFAPPSLVGALLNALPMLSTLASSGAPRRQPTRAAIVGQLKSCHLQAPISDPGLKKSAGRQSQQRVWPGVAPLGVLCRRRQRRPTLRPLICLAYNMKTREAHAPGRKRVVHLSRRGQHERRSFKHKTARSGEGADGGDTKRGGRCSKTQKAQIIWNTAGWGAQRPRARRRGEGSQCKGGMRRCRRGAGRGSGGVQAQADAHSCA